MLLFVLLKGVFIMNKPKHPVFGILDYYVCDIPLHAAWSTSKFAVSSTSKLILDQAMPNAFQLGEIDVAPSVQTIAHVAPSGKKETQAPSGKKETQAPSGKKKTPAAQKPQLVDMTGKKVVMRQPDEQKGSYTCREIEANVCDMLASRVRFKNGCKTVDDFKCKKRRIVPFQMGAPCLLWRLHSSTGLVRDNIPALGQLWRYSNPYPESLCHRGSEASDDLGLQG